MDLVVGIGDYAISSSQADRLFTFALSSCVAVTAYSLSKRVAGMLHVSLPFPQQRGEQRLQPAHYAVTGVPLMINRMRQQHGCLPGELQIGLFGGASSAYPGDVFNVGERNIQAVFEALHGLSLRVRVADLGGTVSRTLRMDVATGQVQVTVQGLAI